jgi:hypothetical protein
MLTLLQFISRISTFIYVLCAIGIFFSFRGMVQARQALRIAVFGLEREEARETLRRSFSTILILFLLVGAVYIVKNILIPNMTGDLDEPTPTPLVFVTQQATPTEAKLLYPTITPTIPVAPADPSAGGMATPDLNINGCGIIGANISSPVPGQTVSGQVPVEGEANTFIFYQYKFEVSGAATGGAWVVVGSFPTAVSNGILGTWDSTSFPPGDYVLRLVILGPEGQIVVSPCSVPIVIAGSDAAPSSP